jgi:hypothetical protein
VRDCRDSDLFLFYFAFVIAVKAYSGVPSRNEVDSISFPLAIIIISRRYFDQKSVVILTVDTGGEKKLLLQKLL